MLYASRKIYCVVKMDAQILKRTVVSKRGSNNYKFIARLVLLRKSSAYICWGVCGMNENGWGGESGEGSVRFLGKGRFMVGSKRY